MKRAGALPALLLLAAAAPVTPIDSDIASGRMVTISPGRTLNLRCTGKGSPTVILEAGFQSWSFAWNSVQPRLAAASRVCSYDRAGMGLSPAAPGVRDGAAITTDLAALLKAAGERPPYILVGHSAGGLHMRRFAATFPKQVVGMVLVDPSVEDQFAAPSAMRDAILARYRLCAAAAQAGRLPATEPDLDRCVPAAKPGAFNAQLRALAATAGYQDTLVSEYAAMPASATGLPQRMADLPLVVLSAGGSDTTPESRARLADWVAAHKRLAARSTRGTQITVPGASHLIQRDAPDAVVSAVEAVRALAAHP